MRSPMPAATKTVLPKPAVAKPRGIRPPVAKPGTGKPLPAKRDATGFDYVAVSDYFDNDNLNISVKEGAQVKVLEKSESGWWYVQSCGAEGWAPSTYLTEKPKPIPKVSVPKVTPRPHDNRPPPARPTPPARPKNTSSGKAKGAAVPPIPSRGKKPTLPRNRNSGSAENLLQLKPTVALKQARSSENLTGRPSSVQYYYVIADYSDDMHDTLVIKQGDKLEVMKRDEGGWWLARLGNQTGWVPSSYLEY